MTSNTPETPRRRNGNAPAAPRCAPAALALILAVLLLPGCAKLDSTVTPPVSTCDPGDPNTPCCGRLAIGPGLQAGFPALGTDTTLDIATWNMLDFPTAGGTSAGARDTTIGIAAQIIGSLNLDVWAVEEIADTTAFAELLRRLPGYAGVFSPDIYGSYSNPPYQKTGVIYRTSVVTLNSVKPILTGDSYAFTRPPIEADLTARGNGVNYHFRLIVQHLKAGTTAEDLARRRDADPKLRTYLDLQRAADPNLPYVVAGDWNGALTEPASNESYPVLLADSSDYKFLDLVLGGQSFYLSHPATGRMLDHLMVNRAACARFSRGKVVTLRPDDYLSYYSRYGSDHRPVMVSAPVFH